MGTREKDGPSPALMTPFQQRKEERDAALFSEYESLLREKPDRSRMMVKVYLKEKYGISSDDVYYKIINRKGQER